MKVARKHLITGLIGNILVFAIGLIGIILLLTENQQIPEILKYFTSLSNLLVVLFSLINAILFAVSIAKGRNYVKEFFQILKMVSVAMCIITFVIVIIFLIPNDKTGFNYYGGSQLFLHLITPIAATFSFIFLEYAPKMRFRFFFAPVIVLILYGIFYGVFAAAAPAGTEVDWYGFMFKPDNRIAPVDFSQFAVGSFLIFLAESFGGALAFGLLLWLLNKIMNLIFIGYVMEEEGESSKEVEETEVEQVEEAEPKEGKSEKKTAPKKTTRSTKPATTKKYKDGARVYHISRSKFVSKKWQVKLASGEKAIKIFDTQLEAINYAKALTRKQGGSIRIHSMKGQLRK